MDLHALLTHLADRGVKLSVNDGLLEIDAPKGVITPELRNSLIEHKTEIANLLEGDLRNTSATALPTLVPEPESRYEPFPLTDMQYAFWVGRSGVLELGEVANHGYYEIEGKDLDLERLNWALQQLIDRHDMLRAIVLPDGRQQVQKTVPPYQMKVVDLRDRTEEVVGAKLQEIRDRLSHQVIPADRWPLFEFSATQLSAGRVRLHISYDLQVFDAWSLFRLFDEWVQLYRQPETQLSPLELSFRDYALADRALQNTELFRRSREYWLDRLDALPPAPDLPLARYPKELKKHRTKRYESGLAPDRWQHLKQRAARAGITPSGLLLAAFVEIIAFWSRSPKFTINLALFNRLPLHPQVNDILGDFTSVTLLAADCSVAEPFQVRATRLQKQLWQDLEHRYFSGVRVTRELANRRRTAPSAMPIVFTSTLGFSSLGQETLTFGHFGELVYGISQASQAWMDIQVWEEKDALTFNWDVVEELFPPGLIDDMFAAYCHFLQRLATDDAAWVETTRQLLPAAQQAQRDALNATDAPIADVLLHQLFAQQVPGRSNEPAVVTRDRILTYQQLYEQSNRVGRRLRQLGVRPNQLVAILMDKGWEQIVAVMGILASGAAYVPLDPCLPRERLLYLLDNSEAQIVLAQSRLVANLVLPDGISCLCVDGSEFDSESAEPLPAVQTPDDLAYVIYTSGSTGVPKGVAVTHRNVVNVVIHTNDRFNVGAGDRILALTALNHDLSVYDIFGLLSAGGTMVMPDATLLKDPSHWIEWMVREEVTLWNSVPAMMEMLVDRAESRSIALPQSLRLAILGGDWLPVSLPDRMRACVPHLQILSIGGPTETTIWNIGYPIDRVDSSWKSIPYGQPMANSKYYILNELLEDCPTWVPGEMYCSGVQVARGYWRDPQKTADRFTTHPRTGERMYRTGDLGRYLPDGNIEFIGRVDFQIKIRGQRIEAGEIEAALTEHSQIKAAVVTAIGQQTHQQRLVAYVMADPNETLTADELRRFLCPKIPEHTIPSAFVFLDRFPLSANGKVDRRSLPNPQDLLQDLEQTYRAPENDIERTIARVWESVLNLEKVGIDLNFFEIGGNSLLIAQTYNELQNVLPDRVRSISLVDLFKFPTVRSLAQYLDRPQESSDLDDRDFASNEKIQVGKQRLQQKLRKAKSVKF